MAVMSGVTYLLEQIQNGRPDAIEELLPLVYDELRRLAADKLRGERRGDSCQPTDLVHEAYLRLVQGDAAHCWDNRRHFFAAAGLAMRRVLVDRARRKLRKKRGGDRWRLDLGAHEPAGDDPDSQLLALDESLGRLAARHPRKAELVQLKYFAGLTLEQAAATLDISPATADRDWRYARAWLAREMRRGWAD
jgi:RNA polymerase sigma factor (TIGR02999 family)